MGQRMTLQKDIERDMWGEAALYPDEIYAVLAWVRLNADEIAEAMYVRFIPSDDLQWKRRDAATEIRRMVKVLDHD